MSVDVLKASMEMWKLMLEGDDKTPAPVKGKEAVYLKPKTLVATANENLPARNTFNDDAVHERWHVVETKRPLNDRCRKLEWTRYIRKELPKIIKWLTTSASIVVTDIEDDDFAEKTLEEFMWTEADKERFRKVTCEAQKERLRKRQLRIEFPSD